MIIKTFQNFKLLLEKDSTVYEYGCILINLDIPNWEELLGKITKDDVYEHGSERYGLEEEPHCTILYGIHGDVTDEEVKQLFSKVKKSDIQIEMKGIDCFYNPQYDVLKINVESPKLTELNELAKTLPHTSNFPDYKPHITIAYLNRGKGRNYIKPTFDIKSYNIRNIIYSKPNGEKIDIPLV
jgi:2'-5' RNA ligase